ncbi:MAG: M23 family metallopeptidase [Deltaproteobacteria bacterium]|nr:M23 family metallopeptidase [Deltaproteobacteria bacterium]
MITLVMLLCTQAPLLEVSWDASTARTGKIVVVDVATPPGLPAIRSLSAELDDHAGVALAISADRHKWRVLVPVDIDSKLVPQPLRIDAVLMDGRATTWKKPVALREGGYDKRTITVGKQFTNPSTKQRQRAEQESLLLSAAMRIESPERMWRGNFLKPTAGLQTSPFGTLRTYNKARRSRHLGWDLDGDVGSPIVAAGRGKILLAMERFYSGGTVLIDHGQGLMTMYFHMSRIDVLAGGFVDKGQPLGAVGASGQVTGPHLHFSVRLGGLYVDPRQLIGLNLSADADDDTAK